MSRYDLSIIYAYHKSAEEIPSDYPAARLPADRIQWLPVFDHNIYDPRENALKKLTEAEGTYTILLDENDKFDPSLPAWLMERLEASDAVFAMPALVFSKVKRVNRYYALTEPADYDINLSAAAWKTTLPPVIPTDLHGLMIRTDALQGALRETLRLPEPEKQTLLYLLRRNPHYLYLGTLPVDYDYPRESDHQFDYRCMSREWYFEPFRQFLLPELKREQKEYGRVSNYLQCLTLYMTHIRIYANTNNRNKRVIQPEEVPDYSAFFSDILQYVELDTLLSQSCVTSYCGTDYRLLDLELKKRDFSYRLDLTLAEKLPASKRFGDTGLFLTCDGKVFSDLMTLPARVNLIDYKDGCLEIDGGVNDLYYDTDAQVYARFDGKRYELTYNHRYSMAKCFGVTYTRFKTFHVSIPVPPSDKERMLHFILCTSGKEFQMDYAFPAHVSRFAKDFPGALWQFGPYAAYWLPDGIHIRKATRSLVLSRQLKLWLDMWIIRKGHRRQIPLKVLNFLLRPYFSRQKIWLFLDKIYKGGDSSEYIYRYAAKQKDGIKKYYLLDKSSADYARMRKEGYRPLKRDSLKHKLVFLNANMVIASNSTVFAFNGYNFRSTFPFRGDVHFDVACVQHGMSVQKIALAQQRLRDNTKLYFCASKYEIENLSKPVYDYIGYDALKLTGVPRYDGLKNRAQRIILLSPTWRMNSAMPVFASEGVARDYNPNFKETSYYKVYNGLINDPRLLAAAKQYGYRIQYVLHPIVSPQIDDFTKNDFVEIISAIGDMSYEKLFCEAALMVTDFSGVQFDFAYMRKPVVYLHHNDIPQHYEEGTFHYATMSFGEICHTNEELIDVLCEYMKNDCAMPELYRKRADDFFAFSDNHNCERIYPVMLEHERNRG